MKNMQRRGRGRHSRGAALVEAAIALPLVLGVLFGTVTGGLAYSQHNAINNAARETSRYGATLVMAGTEYQYLNDMLTEAKLAATGDLDSAVSGQYLCVAYVYPDGVDTGDRTMRLEETLGVRDPTVTTGSTCFSDARPSSERRVQVLLERTTEISAIFFSKSVTLSARSVSRYERSD